MNMNDIMRIVICVLFTLIIAGYSSWIIIRILTLEELLKQYYEYLKELRLRIDNLSDHEE